MALLTLKNVYYSVGEFPLLDQVNFDIQPKERIALIGRNGQGKSTLLKILAQVITPESGDIIKPAYLKVSRLAQEMPETEDMTVYEAVAHGLQDLSALLIRYHQLTSQTDNHDEAWMNQLNELQHAIDQKEGWLFQERVDRITHDLALPVEKKMSDLSGGWRRRVALGQALVQEPDILLLDEPTNHLDLAAIQWLEKMLLTYPKTIIFITHDRALLRKLATKIVELDRGKLTAYPPDYDLYLARKEQSLLEEERHNALFDKKLSDEEQWIRQGVKARRTRNEGRVRALKALREERQQRQVRQDKPKFEMNDLLQAGKTIIQAENVSFGYTPDKILIKDFTFNIQRGDKIAVVGANGAGKTTLIKLMLGDLKPVTGNIKHSPTNQVAFFDQNRENIDKNMTLMENVGQGDDHIEIQGKKKHVIGYLGDFLFSPQKCRTSAMNLSGGEQNRLMLAKLFARPANVLVLDEPTNDLDIESLDVLENLLLNYQGTVIIISHDREFIDNIATHCIAFEEDGRIGINVGGYTDWLERQARLAAQKSPPKKSPPLEKNKVKNQTPSQGLNFQEKQELTTLPLLIEKLEEKINQLQLKMCEPKFSLLPQSEIQTDLIQLDNLKTELAQTYQRWEELESKKC